MSDTKEVVYQFGPATLRISKRVPSAVRRQMEVRWLLQLLLPEAKP